MTTDAERSTLEEERDLLLRSLDELETERASGDLDATDYEALRDGYTARAAAVLRRLDGDDPGTSAAGVRSPTTSGPGRPASVADNGSTIRRWAIVVILAVFAIGAGVLLARAVGERGVNDQLTGGIDESTRDKVIRCQQLGSTGGDLVGSLECFDEILAQDPENAEALSYRGWYLLLAAGSLQDTTQDAQNQEALELIASGLDYLDRAIRADPALPDPLAFRASVYDRLGERESACADIATMLALDPPPFFVDQTSAIAQRNGC